MAKKRKFRFDLSSRTLFSNEKFLIKLVDQVCKEQLLPESERPNTKWAERLRAAQELDTLNRNKKKNEKNSKKRQ